MLQKIINLVFVISATGIIVVSMLLAVGNTMPGGDISYSIGWIWGFISGLCLWATSQGFSTKLF